MRPTPGTNPMSIVCALLAVGAAYSQTEPVAGAPYSPHPANVLVTKVRHFDNMCWKIAAAGGTWYFETGETAGKTGFSSAFDQAGNDWIGNDADKGYNKSPSNGGKHEYRGWPNFGEGNFDHPQRSSGSQTRWVAPDGKDLTFSDKLEGSHLVLRSSNSTYEVEYHFFPTHAAIKVLKAGNNYAFLFEGPVGGEQEKSISKDHYVLKDGIKRMFNSEASPFGGLGWIDPAFSSTKQFPSPFFYFVDTDPKDQQILYVGAKGLAPSSYGDEGWMQCNASGANMVIFSFGRKNDKRSLTGTGATSVFGFLPRSNTHEQTTAFIEDRLKAPFVPTTSTSVGPTTRRTPTMENGLLGATDVLYLRRTSSGLDLFGMNGRRVSPSGPAR